MRYRVLRQGQRVEFEMQSGPRGAFAKHVIFLDDPSESVVPPIANEAPAFAAAV